MAPSTSIRHSPMKHIVKLRHIVKRKGRFERFDERKLYASIYAAALNCHYKEREAEKLAVAVSSLVKKSVFRKKGKKAVSSDDIRKHVLKHLKDKDVALMYRHHLDLC